MRKNRLTVAILLVMTMLLGIMTTAFAADYTPVDPDDQGKTGIVGGDTLTFTEDTVWANLTARWGVRVIFRDGDEWNNAELKSELIPVTDSAAGSTTAPDDPSHDGWTFTGWERVDTNNGSSALNDDGTVTGINGPGPIIYQAVYEPIPPKAGGLTVSKTVSGNAADTTQAFTFTVTLSDTSISGEFGDMTFEEGIATFTLKDGESKTAEGLPAGVSYIVAESDNEGYEVTKTGDTGTIAADAEATAAFTNTKNTTPPEDPGKPEAPDKSGDPGTPKTGEDSNMALWISLLLASFIGIIACIILFRKKRAGKHMRTFMMLLLVGVMAFSCFGATSAFAAEDGTTGYTYGQYDMTYLPGTTDTVTNMPANETGLTPGADSPYTVSSTVPVREGFEFIDWTLTWGTMEKPPVLTDYVVKYLDKDTNEPVAADKVQTGLEVGTSVTENAIPVDGYTAVDPTEATLVLAETGNEIIFYYEKQPVLTDYVVKYLDKDTNEPVADEKTESGLEVGTSVTETAIPVGGYAALDPTETTLVLAETGNEIIFYYQKLTTYTIHYCDDFSGEDIAEPKTVTDVPVGETYTEYALDIQGYIALDNEITFTLMESGNDYYLYYTKSGED